MSAATDNPAPTLAQRLQSLIDCSEPLEDLDTGADGTFLPMPIDGFVATVQSALALAIANEGVALIAAERQRQITAEGWTPEHDAEHDDGALARAAGCYAYHSARSSYARDGDRKANNYPPPGPWPWDARWWKPGSDNSNESRARELTKAGALIAAEIDRLLRATPPASTQKGKL